MKGLIQSLIDDEKMSNDNAEGIEGFYFFSINADYMKYRFGSNYVLVEIIMSTKEEENNKEVIEIINKNVDE